MSFGTGFVVDSILERLKSVLDLVELRSKYNDEWFLNNEFVPAISDVLERLSGSESGFPVLVYSITLDSDERRYVLPPCVRSVVRMVEVNAQGDRVAEWLPRNELSSEGFGWRIEGNELVFQHDPPDGDVINLDYIHNGDLAMHTGTGTWDGTSMQLDSTPTLGALDLRPGAYVGQMLRVKGTTNAPIFERLIVSHEWSSPNWTVTPRTSFPASLTADDYQYEIVPWSLQELWEAIVYKAALRLSTKLAVTQKLRGYLMADYNSALKTAIQTLQLMQGRRPPHFEEDTGRYQSTYLG